MSAIAEAAIIWKLKSVNAVSNAATGGIYPRIAPEGTIAPYIIVDRTPGQIRSQTARGPGALHNTPMTIFCVGKSDATGGGYKQSRDLCRLVEAAINPSGVTGSVSWNGTSVDHCSVLQTYDASVDPKTADEVGYPVEALDCVLFHLNCDSTG